jgi:hypothetical protein
MAVKSRNGKYRTEECLIMQGLSTAERVDVLPVYADFSDCPFCR